MRTRLIVASLIIFFAAIGFGVYRFLTPPPSQQAVSAPDAAATSSAVADVASPGSTILNGAASPAATDAETPAATDTATPSATDTATPGATDTATPGATDTPAPGATDSPTASPSPTIPAEPTGLSAGWDQMTERTVNGKEADLLVRTGDINNLGYGWPAKFTPFSGKSTPAHEYPCNPRPGAPAGTDRIMLGTGVTDEWLKKGGGDGYSGCSTRPGNLPEAISLDVGDLPAKIHVVLVQLFADDFQAPVYGSHFQISLNGTRIPSFEAPINALQQTGPIGKLVTMRLLPEYYPLLRTGNVSMLIDDPTTHKLDGYAIDFARILVNPRPFEYAVNIACTVVDAATNKPISGAAVSAAQVSGITRNDGTSLLRGVPAGMASVTADAVGYDSAVQLLDLPVGTDGVAQFALKKHKEAISDLAAQIAKTGSVQIYGIHFDTASATLRPDSLASLQTVLQLLKSSRGSKWIIAGHTDNQGGADYNLNLSQARARSVVTWLTQHGIAADRLVAQGFGLTRPVADNATASGRALNRRVEVKVTR